MATVKGDSTTAIPAVSGENTAGGDGVFGKGRRGVVGQSDSFQGVFGKSVDNAGVVGESSKLHGVFGICHNPNGAGVFGTNDQVGGFGVQGINPAGDGVIGTGRRGVVGQSDSFQGVFGKSIDNAGVVGESSKLHGVFGICHNPNGAGVFATNDAGGFGVIGISPTNTGVVGESDTGVGVRGKGGRLAGLFEGDVEVTGDIRLPNADCAEDFDIAGAATVAPGTVMVLCDEATLQPSTHAYDRRVAGVISGAGGYRPGIVFDKQQGARNRSPVALLGKVFCCVDASYGPIEVGDLLTTSPTPGHAMRVDDPLRAFGAVIGKALRPLTSGQGLIPILIALQ